MSQQQRDDRRRPVLLALGANLGDPAAQLRRALGELGGVLTSLRVSSLYRTAPVGYLDQPDFYNLVCSGETRLGPRELLREMQHIEAALGRTRPFANAPRTLDIDLLAYGDLLLETPELTLPHPRLHERGFVLVPLVEIAPDWRHPRLGRTARELLQALGPTQGVERVGRSEG